ncbi:hypothetical protein F0562_017633 [Nyssa sinensis]|uniref:Reverse transcriptase Ty1/copia-type domain-containing protein n=1 Tax=Nyssa sinensis TaxID=561372 RepID=A0A5J4ZJH0_9ASTE|nr:hypothetical protein F0562_017633 [Nyssa sinensis]
MVSEPSIANAFVDPMAAITDASLPSAAFHLPAQVISIKLDGTNYLAWSAQLIPLFRSYGLMGIVDGSEPSTPQFSSDDQKAQGLLNSAYVVWQYKDQTVLVLGARFAASSTSRISLIKRKLQSLQQGSMSCQNFLDEVKSLADELSVVGKPIDDSDLILSILNGLNSSFHCFVTTYMLLAKEKSMPFSYVHAESLNYDLMQKFHSPSIQPKVGPYALYSHKDGSKSGSRNNTNKSHFSGPSKGLGEGHQALDCFNRMNYSFQGHHPPTELAAMVAEANTTYLNQHQWYTDSDANIHVTSDIANLATSQPYEGDDSMGVGNGTGLTISRTATASIITPSSILTLNNIAYCPQALAHLLSINKFCKDNNVLFELTGSNFSVKDVLTGNMLLTGPSANGLYPINLRQLSSSKFHALTMTIGIKASTSKWHCHLGHLSAATLHRVISKFSLPLSNSINKQAICLKRQPDGSIKHHKARLVAIGYLQRSGIDFHDTFSPIIKTSTVRMVLALAVSFNWDIRQLDVSNTFLYGILEDEVYMTQPKGFEDPVHPQFVCKLHKSLYGLKQAPRAWFNHLSIALLSLGFHSSQVDPSLFTYHHGSVHFAMKDLGQLTYFLGIEATRSPSRLHLWQTRYIIDLFDRIKFLGIRPYPAPCVSGSKLSKFAGDLLSDPSEYRQMVGALQYVTLTHPDIAYSVNHLCQHMQAPTSAHGTAAKHVLCYLKNTLDYGLFYKPSSFSINAYCDSDWAGDPDDRRSMCGYGVYVGSNLISWSANKQPVVSKCSTEAEYRCLALVMIEVYWLRMLLCELKVSLESTPVVWCDNISALALASNLIFHARSKHIEVDYHFVSEKVAN